MHSHVEDKTSERVWKEQRWGASFYTPLSISHSYCIFLTHLIWKCKLYAKHDFFSDIYSWCLWISKHSGFWVLNAAFILICIVKNVFRIFFNKVLVLKLSFYILLLPHSSAFRFPLLASKVKFSLNVEWRIKMSILHHETNRLTILLLLLFVFNWT
jgi:hypothetical protein